MGATIDLNYGCAVTTGATFMLYYIPAAEGSGGVTVSVLSDAPMDTYFTVYFTIVGEYSNTLSQNLTIGPGNTCSSGTFYGFYPGENVAGFFMDSYSYSGSLSIVYGGASATYSLPC